MSSHFHQRSLSASNRSAMPGDRLSAMPATASSCAHRYPSEKPIYSRLPHASSDSPPPIYGPGGHGPNAKMGSARQTVRTFFKARNGKLRRGRVAAALAVGTVVLWWWVWGGRLKREWEFLPDDVSQPPPVPKTVLDKLGALEDALGGPDGGEVDVTGLGMMPLPGGSPAAPDRDAESLLRSGDQFVHFGDPPLVNAIPQPLRYPKQPLPQPSLALRTPAAELDPPLCPAQTALGLPCRFLLPGFIGEQETKAQTHLHQLGLLALHLNRTLILPQVSKSRMGTCYAYPFSLYYAPNSLQQLGIPTIAYADFLAWTQLRDPAPTAQMVAIMSHKSDYPQGAIEIDPALPADQLPHKPERNFCFSKGRARMTWERYSPLTVWGPERFSSTAEGKKSYGDSIVRSLTQEETAKRSWRAPPPMRKIREDGEEVVVAPQRTPADVLVVNYEIRFPVLNAAEAPTTLALSQPLPPFSNFDYAPTWLRLGQLISNQLSPYVAVHWRQETLPVEALAPCAESLIATLAGLKAEHPDLKGFYLATDYPIEDLEAGKEGIAAHSGTFNKLLTKEHHASMRKFLKNLELSVASGSGLPMTTFVREQARLKLPADLKAELATGLPAAPAAPLVPGTLYPEGATQPAAIDLADLDAGLLGIVDKAVAMRAEVFVSGVPGECAKLSSFTRQIVETRKAGLAPAPAPEAEAEAGTEEGGGGPSVRLRNVVEFWGLPEGEQ